MFQISSTCPNSSHNAQYHSLGIIQIVSPRLNYYRLDFHRIWIQDFKPEDHLVRVIDGCFISEQTTVLDVNSVRSYCEESGFGPPHAPWVDVHGVHLIRRRDGLQYILRKPRHCIMPY